MKIVLLGILLGMGTQVYTVHSNIKDVWKKYVSGQTMDEKAFENIKEEISFWTLQMKEHALFMFLGFEDAALKKSANDLHTKFQRFEESFKKNPTAGSVKELLPLLDQEKALQKKAIGLMETGKWIGWLYPSLLQHMTMELDYFYSKLNGSPYNTKDEVNFWKKEAQDKIGVMAHLLDPSEKALVAEAEKIEQYFNVPASQKEGFIESALAAVEKVNGFGKRYDVNKRSIKSIINDLLAAHELREGARGEKILKSLAKS